MTWRRWRRARGTQRVFRLLALIGLLITDAFVPAAAAQTAAVVPPTLEAVHDRLHSDSASEVAWGAFLAAQFQMKEAIAAIVDRLQRPPDTDRNQREHLIAGMLDSLIQLGGRVPAATLLPYYDQWPIHTLVLLGSASDGRDAALLDILRAADGEKWFGAANLLLATRPTGFPAALLRDLTLTLSVTVSDAEYEAEVSGEVGGAFSHGDGIGEIPAGFPPYAHYAFGGTSGAIVLALGPTPVYYTRIVRNTFQFQTWANARSGPTDRDRLAYLEPLLGLERVTLYPSDVAVVQWIDERRFPSQIEDAKAKLAERYGGLIAALIKNQQLREEEARGLPARIMLKVFDRRTKASRPLPSVD